MLTRLRRRADDATGCVKGPGVSYAITSKERRRRTDRTTSMETAPSRRLDPISA